MGNKNFLILNHFETVERMSATLDGDKNFENYISRVIK